MFDPGDTWCPECEKGARSSDKCWTCGTETTEWPTVEKRKHQILNLIGFVVIGGLFIGPPLYALKTVAGGIASGGPAMATKTETI